MEAEIKRIFHLRRLMGVEEGRRLRPKVVVFCVMRWEGRKDGVWGRWSLFAVYNEREMSAKGWVQKFLRLVLSERAGKEHKLGAGAAETCAGKQAMRAVGRRKLMPDVSEGGGRRRKLAGCRSWGRKLFCLAVCDEFREGSCLDQGRFGWLWGWVWWRLLLVLEVNVVSGEGCVRWRLLLGSEVNEASGRRSAIKTVAWFGGWCGECRKLSAVKTIAGIRGWCW